MDRHLQARPPSRGTAPVTGTLLTLALWLAASGAAAQTAQPAPGAAPMAPLRVQLLQIIDRQGFERPLEAYSMFVPAGWRTEAAVRWNIQAPCVRPYQPVFRAEAPDGSAVLELAPGEGWGRGSMGPLAPGCPVAVFASAEQYLQSWLQRHRPGARLLEMRPRPDKQVRLPPMQAQGIESRRLQDAAQALIETAAGGRVQRELLVTVVSLSQVRMANLMGGPPMETMSGESGGVLSWRAAGAGPDPRAFDALWSTWRRNPEWHDRIARANQQMAQENAQTQAQIAQLRHQGAMETLREQAQRGENAHRTRQEIAQMQTEGWQNRQQSQDRQHQASVQALRGVQPWRTSGGDTVELPNHWRHAWKLKDGSYLLTDDPNFDPARQLRIEGEALKPAR
jgi:hypothetical protein